MSAFKRPPNIYFIGHHPNTSGIQKKSFKCKTAYSLGIGQLNPNMAADSAPESKMIDR